MKSSTLRQLLCNLALLCSVVTITQSETVKLTLLHYNDINCQVKVFEKGDPTLPGTYGGLGSLVNYMKSIEAEEKSNNVFRVAAGNLVSGENGWLSINKWDAFGDLIKQFYKPEVMALGIKDFESGLARTNDYLTKANVTNVLVSNLRCNKSATGHEKAFCEKIKPSSILSLKTTGRSEYTVGFVGFVNQLSEKISDPGALKFEDVPSELSKIVESDLKDVNTIIAVGSGNMEMAKKILDTVAKIKVVILSGSYNMTNYPEEYNGKFIVKAGMYGETFGRLVLNIETSNGTVTKHTDTKLIDNDGGKGSDSGATGVVAEFDKKVQKAEDTKIGRTLVQLEGTREKCWRSECNLGNLIADAMVHCAFNQSEFFSKPEYAHMIGVWTSGSIVDDKILAGKEISALDVHKWLPYHNLAYVVKMKGSLLWQIFQTSGGAIFAPGNGNKDWGQFLQVSSGIEVVYSTSGELKSLRVHQIDDSQPVLRDVDANIDYHVVIPSFMYLGRSVYDFIPGQLSSGPAQGDKTSLGFDDDCLNYYINGLNILSVGFEKRISITDGDSDCKGANTATTVFLTLLIFILIIGAIYCGYAFVWPRIRQRGHTSHFP